MPKQKRTGWEMESVRVYRKKGWPAAVIVSDVDGTRTILLYGNTRWTLKDARDIAHSFARESEEANA